MPRLPAKISTKMSKAVNYVAANPDSALSRSLAACRCRCASTCSNYTNNIAVVFAIASHNFAQKLNTWLHLLLLPVHGEPNCFFASNLWFVATYHTYMPSPPPHRTAAVSKVAIHFDCWLAQVQSNCCAKYHGLSMYVCVVPWLLLGPADSCHITAALATAQMLALSADYDRVFWESLTAVSHISLPSRRTIHTYITRRAAAQERFSWYYCLALLLDSGIPLCGCRVVFSFQISAFCVSWIRMPSFACSLRPKDSALVFVFAFRYCFCNFRFISVLFYFK